MHSEPTGQEFKVPLMRARAQGVNTGVFNLRQRHSNAHNLPETPAKPAHRPPLQNTTPVEQQTPSHSSFHTPLLHLSTPSAANSHANVLSHKKSSLLDGFGLGTGDENGSFNIRSSSSLLELMHQHSPSDTHYGRTEDGADIADGFIDGIDDTDDILSSSPTGAAGRHSMNYYMKPPPPMIIHNTPFVHLLTPQYFNQTNASTDYVLPVPPSSHLVADPYKNYYEMEFDELQQLGRGSFGWAFKVFRRSDGQVFAIKKTRHVFHGYKDRLRQLIEVEVMLHLQQYQNENGTHGHRNVLWLENAWEQNGYLYLMMEFCPRGDLESWLDSLDGTCIHERTIWPILTDLILGLRFIHRRGVLHLDLKPSNILIDTEWTLKIADFGMAMFYAHPTRSVHETIELMGEREGDSTYLAPEVLQRGEYSTKADMFSLGCILVEVLSGCLLPAQGPEWHALREGHSEELLMKNRENVSDEMVNVIRGLLEPISERRWGTEQVMLVPHVADLAMSLIQAGVSI